jgi:photosystem II stability/assembly factor-like uncharacterized protein
MSGDKMKMLYYFFALNIITFYSLQGQWVRTTGPTGAIYSLAASGNNLFAGNNTGKIFGSTDNGVNWNIVYSGSPTRTDAIAISDTNIFAATGAGILLSTNNGASWTASGLSNSEPQALAVYNDGAGNTNLFAGTFHNGVFKSTDNGVSWSPVNSGLTGSALYVTALFVSDTNLFSGTWGSSAFRSVNNGASWTLVNNGLTSNNVHAFSVLTSKAGSTNLFAGTYFGSGIYLSTDNGESWAVVNTGLTNNNIRTLANYENNLFAGSWGNGVFLSTNNGIIWNAFNTGPIGNYEINALVICGSEIFAGTNDGVWKRPLSDIITDAVDQNVKIPSQFSLDQNYPNPFNPATTINFSIAEVAKVTLSIFNILGEPAGVLKDEVLKPGVYNVTFEGSSLASGVYLYRLQAGNFIQTRKMMLMK